MIYHTYKGWRRPWIVAAATVFSIYLLAGCGGAEHTAIETEPIAGGVERVHILDGRIPHSILIELLSDRGIGTMLKKEEKA